MIQLALALVAFILAAVTLLQSQFQSLTAYAILALAVAMLIASGAGAYMP